MNSNIFKSFTVLFSLFVLLSYNSNSQGLAGLNSQDMTNPVKWTHKAKSLGNNEYMLIFKATAEEHWHFYSQYTEGTMPMLFTFDKPDGYKTIGKVSESPKPKEEFDDLLGG
jgi:thiol:disulfide interchange protein DsbD